MYRFIFSIYLHSVNAYFIPEMKNQVVLLRAEEKKGGFFGNIFNSLAANEFKPKNEEEKEFLKR